MAFNLGNCPRCGKVFARGVHDVCPACVKEIEEEYERCHDYLKEHKGVTIYELSEATEVSVRQITKFIREGRISLEGAPNLAYPCESCGMLIREGTICDSCRKRLSRDYELVKLMEQTRQERENAAHTYQMYNNNNNNNDQR